MSTKQTIAFFGATGGCAGSSLACALREGYHCTALARTPSKLETFLTTTHAIPAATLSSLLTIHRGDAKNPEDVARVLVSPLSPTHLVSTIYTAIGAYPSFKWSLSTPFVLSDPNVCTDGVRAIFTALTTLASAQNISSTPDGAKPLLIALSSTGVNGKTRDIPLAYAPLYHFLAAQPHADKRAMEKVIVDESAKYTRGFVIIRPTALTDGEKGVAKVRAGWEWGVAGEGRAKEDGPAIGWVIGRKDVGAWVFKKVIQEGGWEDRCVSLTY
ncbi:hypothetical protein BU23DRAFT_519001 [Bimuria novae-zelandiae CBS 107.79]|uniref:Uncharacterized protein n=1 Tax=Bimuria novae-zelandiae CBS 107.79 TaxID=1447943 RepID=A0A6A5UM51_9PLEO|nr:hypothetical protein BU23DRAFT_519001 [Bimuria novae-zelandiae CBS 107.79]